MEDFNVIPDYDKLMSSPMSKLTERVVEKAAISKESTAEFWLRDYLK